VATVQAAADAQLEARRTLWVLPTDASRPDVPALAARFRPVLEAACSDVLARLYPGAGRVV
jgi:hypothetical protein